MKKESANELVYGRWPVKEALDAGPVSKIFLARGVDRNSVKEIVTAAKKKKVQFLWVERKRLDLMTKGSHQGVVALISPLTLVDYRTLLEKAVKTPSTGPALLFLDGIQDPQNVGSILRSAVFHGVQGVVTTKWRSAPLTGAVVRASAGAARLISIAQVSNLTTAMQQARKQGLWLVGADMKGENAKKADVPRPFALVMGAEGDGLHRLVRENCDVLVAIPGSDQRKGIDSLNVSVACGILLFAFNRQ